MERYFEARIYRLPGFKKKKKKKQNKTKPGKGSLLVLRQQAV